LAAIGLVVLDIRNPFFTEIARGVEDAAGDRGLSLMLASSDQDPTRERRILSLFAAHAVAGVVAVPASDDVFQLVELAGRGTPVVLLDHPSPVEQLPSVAVDNVAGGQLAVRHLLGGGAEQVVMLNGSHRLSQCRDRWEGARRAVRAAGLTPDSALTEVRVGSIDAAGGAAAIEEWLAFHDGCPPEALFCVNDLVAIGAAGALRNAGLDPADTPMVGYDNLELAAELAVPLTSVAQPTYEMGRSAAELLRQQAGADAAAPAGHLVFQPELVVRASSRPSRRLVPVGPPRL
jgi:LacI family transcriptional regulator